jgi:hypothetical protein
MSYLPSARALIGLVGAASLGCSASHPSFLSGGSSSARSPAAPTAAVTGASAEPTSPSSTAKAVTYADLQPITSSDVIHWTGRGVREDIIIERIERSSSVFHLTGADENHLRDKGVSEAVIQEMKATAQR